MTYEFTDDDLQAAREIVEIMPDNEPVKMACMNTTEGNPPEVNFLALMMHVHGMNIESMRKQLAVMRKNAGLLQAAGYNQGELPAGGEA